MCLPAKVIEPGRCPRRLTSNSVGVAPILGTRDGAGVLRQLGALRLAVFLLGIPSRACRFRQRVGVARDADEYARVASRLHVHVGAARRQGRPLISTQHNDLVSGWSALQQPQDPSANVAGCAHRGNL